MRFVARTPIDSRASRTVRWPLALPTPYGETGAIGVDSSWVGCVVAPKISALLALTNVMSRAFAALTRESRSVVSLGQHAVKGLMVPPEIFTLEAFAPASAVAAQ